MQPSKKAKNIKDEAERRRTSTGSASITPRPLGWGTTRWGTEFAAAEIARPPAATDDRPSTSHNMSPENASSLNDIDSHTRETSLSATRQVAYSAEDLTRLLSPPISTASKWGTTRWGTNTPNSAVSSSVEDLTLEHNVAVAQDKTHLQQKLTPWATQEEIVELYKGNLFLPKEVIVDLLRGKTNIPARNEEGDLLQPDQPQSPSNIEVRESSDKVNVATLPTEKATTDLNENNVQLASATYAPEDALEEDHIPSVPFKRTHFQEIAKDEPVDAATDVTLLADQLINKVIMSALVHTENITSLPQPDVVSHGLEEVTSRPAFVEVASAGFIGDPHILHRSFTDSCAPNKEISESDVISCEDECDFLIAPTTSIHSETCEGSTVSAECFGSVREKPSYCLPSLESREIVSERSSTPSISKGAFINSVLSKDCRELLSSLPCASTPSKITSDSVPVKPISSTTSKKSDLFELVTGKEIAVSLEEDTMDLPVTGSIGKVESNVLHLKRNLDVIPPKNKQSLTYEEQSHLQDHKHCAFISCEESCNLAKDEHVAPFISLIEEMQSTLRYSTRNKKEGISPLSHRGSSEHLIIKRVSFSKPFVTSVVGRAPSSVLSGFSLGLSDKNKKCDFILPQALNPISSQKQNPQQRYVEDTKPRPSSAIPAEERPDFSRRTQCIFQGTRKAPADADKESTSDSKKKNNNIVLHVTEIHSGFFARGHSTTTSIHKELVYRHDTNNSRESSKEQTHTLQDIMYSFTVNVDSLKDFSASNFSSNTDRESSVKLFNERSSYNQESFGTLEENLEWYTNGNRSCKILYKNQEPAKTEGLREAYMDKDLHLLRQNVESQTSPDNKLESTAIIEERSAQLLEDHVPLIAEQENSKELAVMFRPTTYTEERYEDSNVINDKLTLNNEMPKSSTVNNEPSSSNEQSGTRTDLKVNKDLSTLKYTTKDLLRGWHENKVFPSEMTEDVQENRNPIKSIIKKSDLLMSWHSPYRNVRYTVMQEDKGILSRYVEQSEASTQGTTPLEARAAESESTAVTRQVELSAVEPIVLESRTNVSRAFETSVAEAGKCKLSKSQEKALEAWEIAAMATEIRPIESILPGVIETVSSSTEIKAAALKESEERKVEATEAGLRETDSNISDSSQHNTSLTMSSRSVAKQPETKSLEQWEIESKKFEVSAVGFRQGTALSNNTETSQSEQVIYISRAFETNQSEARAAEFRNGIDWSSQSETRQPQQMESEARASAFRNDESRAALSSHAERSQPKPSETESRAVDASQPKPRETEVRAVDASQSKPRETEVRTVDARQPKLRETESRAVDASQRKPRETEVRAVDASQPKPRETEVRAVDASQSMPRETEVRTVDASQSKPRETESRAVDVSQPRPSPEVRAVDVSQLKPRETEVRTVDAGQSKPRETEVRTVDASQSKPRETESRAVNAGQSKPRETEVKEVDASQSKPRETEVRTADVSQPKPRETEVRTVDASQSKPRETEVRAVDASQPKPRETEVRAVDAGQSKPRETEVRAVDASQSKPRETEVRTVDASQPKPRETEVRAVDAGQSKPRETEVRTVDASQSKPRETEVRTVDASQSKPRETEVRAVDASQSKPRETEVRADESNQSEATRSAVVRSVRERPVAQWGMDWNSINVTLYSALFASVLVYHVSTGSL